jgi:hypothetical protein
MRDYRPAAQLLKTNTAKAEGFRDGVQTVVDYLRREVGSHALTGYQLARDIEKSHLGADSGEMIARRGFIVSLRGM